MSGPWHPVKRPRVASSKRHGDEVFPYESFVWTRMLDVDEARPNGRFAVYTNNNTTRRQLPPPEATSGCKVHPIFLPELEDVRVGFTEGGVLDTKTDAFALFGIYLTPAGRPVYVKATQATHTRGGNDLEQVWFSALAPGMDLYHTFTPKRHRGRGLAQEVCNAAASFAASQGMLLFPTCSYAAAHFHTRPPAATRMDIRATSLGDQVQRRRLELARLSWRGLLQVLPGTGDGVDGSRQDAWDQGASGAGDRGSKALIELIVYKEFALGAPRGPARS